MKNHPFSRAELIFWDLTIQALSESGVTRSFLRKFYQLTHSPEITSMSIIVGISGAAGLASGYLFYFLTNSLR